MAEADLEQLEVPDEGQVLEVEKGEEDGEGAPRAERVCEGCEGVHCEGAQGDGVSCGGEESMRRPTTWRAFHAGGGVGALYSFD